MKYLLIIILYYLTPYISNSQSNINQDKLTLLKMCGCFEVTFNFAETFNFFDNPDYNPSPVKTEKALELIVLVDETDDKLVLQHILQSNDDNPFIIKHWRQDWIYENYDIYYYNKNNIWEYQLLDQEDVSGKWTQKVFQIDDMPRYQGYGTWVYIDGKSYWEGQSDAPLPRRESKIRNDYNVLVRNNRVEVTDDGWIHDQDNAKLFRNNLGDNVVAYEKGYNIYKRVSNDRCEAAMLWWNNNLDRWNTVRLEWDQILRLNSDLRINIENNSSLMYKEISSIDNYNRDTIRSIINQYIIK